MQACGASREPLTDSGWVCDGTNLVVLSDASGPIATCGTVAVIRADLLDDLGDVYRGFTPAPFLGGDHVHLSIRQGE
jgi:hypothetical protein